MTLPTKFRLMVEPLRTVRLCRTLYQWAVKREIKITGYIGTYFPPDSVRQHRS